VGASTRPFTSPGPRNVSTLVTLFGWVISGHSLLNLLRDFTPLDLYGRLAEWMHAYAKLVAAIAKPLFGRVHWRWMSVDSIDAHILVVTLMFCSALARASTEVQMKGGDGRLRAMQGAWTASLVVVFFPVLIVLIVLPKPIDAIVGAAILLFLFTYFGFVFVEQDRDVPPAHIVRRELIGVLAVVVLLIVLNYTVFHW
jgi:hypothetical protein